MFQLTQLGNDPRQELEMILDSNIRIKFIFEYRENQLGWFFGFKYGANEYTNIRLTTSYNILRAYRNWLPFGLRCDTADDEEPMGLNDFVNGYATVYLLTKADVQAIEGNYYVKVPAELQN